MRLPKQGVMLAGRRVHLAMGMPKQGLLLLLFFATAASDDARAPARATTACERRVLSAQKPSSLAAAQLAALETTAVASMRSERRFRRSGVPMREPAQRTRRAGGRSQ